LTKIVPVFNSNGSRLILEFDETQNIIMIDLTTNAVPTIIMNYGFPMGFYKMFYF